ncbi:MAG: hypothetical protein ABW178_05035 [Pseudoxanthomonas sp.]
MPHPAFPIFLTCALTLVVGVARAQSVVVKDNVRLEYAQVLSVDPVYQTLRASRIEQQCDEVDKDKKKEVVLGEDGKPKEGKISRMVDSVKEFFGSPSEGESTAVPEPSAPQGAKNCRLVQVDREFRRPIAYDVDYVWKGTKYRSRLAEDPGNRLRIRVAVTPYVPGQPALQVPQSPQASTP